MFDSAFCLAALAVFSLPFVGLPLLGVYIVIDGFRSY